MAVDIYGLSRESGARPDYGFLDQIRRSSVSIASNLAEGAERGTPKDSVHFFVMARAMTKKWTESLGVPRSAPSARLDAILTEERRI